MDNIPKSYKYLEDLCKSQDRYSLLCENLKRLGVEFLTMQLGDAKNILCKFYSPESPRKTYIKVLAAHYDTVDGVVGANDNLASVAQLLYLAEKLRKQGYGDSVAIAFLDKEELMGKRNLRDSGSYKLGAALKRRGINSSLFFTFDVCGNGDTIIISKATEGLLFDAIKMKKINERLGRRLVHNITLLKRHVYTYLDNSGFQYMPLMTPGSDDLSLNLNGIPAALISVLPQEEAFRVKVNLVQGKEDPNYPNTWRKINGVEDTIETVSIETMKEIEEFMQGFYKINIPMEYLRDENG